MVKTNESIERQFEDKAQSILLGIVAIHKCECFLNLCKNHLAQLEGLLAAMDQDLSETSSHIFGKINAGEDISSLLDKKQSLETEISQLKKIGFIIRTQRIPTAEASINKAREALQQEVSTLFLSIWSETLSSNNITWN